MSTNAEAIAEAILGGAPFLGGLNDMSLQAAFDVQDAVVSALAARQGGFGGYKIAWNAPPLMEKFEMPHPGMGRVMSDEVYADGAKLALGSYQNLMIETEIIARLARDIGPGDRYVPDSVQDAVEGFTCGFEILDRRQSPPDASASAILCHNVFNAGLVAGTTWIEAHELDAGALRTVLTRDGEVVTDDTGLAPQPPLEALAFLANHFCDRGGTMEAGQLVLCGSHIPLLPIEAPGEYTLSMGVLGRASFSVS